MVLVSIFDYNKNKKIFMALNVLEMTTGYRCKARSKNTNLRTNRC